MKNLKTLYFINNNLEVLARLIKKIMRFSMIIKYKYNLKI